MSSCRRLAIGAALGLVIGSTAFVSAAGAATLACGQTITVNTTLDNDVGPCAAGGIIVGANNITFNLNGHHIFGTPQSNDGAGILAQGRTGVTIRNGTVSSFDGGVVIDGGSGNTVQQISARNNVGEASDVIETAYGDGILVLNSTNNRLLQNTAARNGPYAGITLLANADNNLVQGNVAEANDVLTQRGHHGGPGTMQDDNGIRLETGGGVTPDFNRIIGNTVRGNGYDGITLFALSNDNLIEGNNVTANGLLGDLRPGDGIHVFGRAQRNVIKSNYVVGNARHGIMLDFFDPFSFPFPGNNRVERNTSVKNGANPMGFPAFDLDDNNRFCDGNTWVANTFLTRNNPGGDCIH